MFSLITDNLKLQILKKIIKYSLLTLRTLHNKVQNSC